MRRSRTRLSMSLNLEPPFLETIAVCDPKQVMQRHMGDKTERQRGWGETTVFSPSSTVRGWAWPRPDRPKTRTRDIAAS